MNVRARFFDFQFLNLFCQAIHITWHIMHKKWFLCTILKQLKISLPIGNRYNYYSMVKNRNNRNNRNKFQINKAYIRFI